MSEDIRYRQNRYLIMMGIRTLCFIAAILMFVNHLGWLAGIPAVGALFIPYFAVIFANGGREPDNVRGFMEYRTNLPAPRDLLTPRLVRLLARLRRRGTALPGRASTHSPSRPGGDSAATGRRPSGKRDFRDWVVIRS